MSNNHQNKFTSKALDRFLEDTFELAFGDDAINKEYSMSEVVEKLKEYSDKAGFYELKVLEE